MSSAVTSAPAVLLRYIEGLKAHDVDQIVGTTAPDLRFIAATRVLTQAQFRAMISALYAGFPDWHYDHDPVELHGERYAVRWRQGGTHTGVWAMPGMDPIPPTGKRVQIPPHFFHYRVANDLITEIHPEPIPGGAPRGILEQIGVPLPPL